MSDSLYDRIGGAAAVDAAVDLFYRKVLADAHISHFFDAVDMDAQAAKQKAFIAMALGGPNQYTGGDMRRVHTHLVKAGLDDSHFDAVVTHLADTLKELGVDEDSVVTIGAALEGLRADVLCR